MTNPGRVLLGGALLGLFLAPALPGAESAPGERGVPAARPAPGGGSAPGRPLRQGGELPPAALPPVPAAADFCPSGLDRPLSQRYLRQFQAPSGLAWLNLALSRGAPYLGFIREELRKRDLPPELLYLPVIESSYLSTARSGSGAVGLWQFMKNSIAPFDMRVDDWIDERMDFWKSTEGALRKLEENYRYFGDWPLALAAYNAGFGAVSRIVRETGIRDYWVLSERKLLKSETIQYVPKFLAAAHILSNPRRHGLEPRWEKDPRWTRVPVKGMVDLELLAAASGLEAAGLKGANQELRFGITPPEEGYFLKVPAAGAGALAGALEGREAPLLRYYLHTLRSGDTLSGLALHYGVSTAQILSANPGTEERRLRIGARLRIPALREPGPERKTEGPEDRRPFEGSYRVRRGDTLWSIARAHGVSVEALAEANSMAVNGVLREGSVLKTPILKTREGNSD